MILKEGSEGEHVKTVQTFLGVKVTGRFDIITENAVKKYQRENGLKDDGVIGIKTWNSLALVSTDLTEPPVENIDLTYDKEYLPKGEYFVGPTVKEWCFLHHTAGWDNPINVIKSWGRDNRGSIATEFVIGGPNIKGNDNTNDGKLVQAFPKGGYGWHLGTGNNTMHRNSVGIEVCNFGYLKDKKTYTGTAADDSQIISLAEPFRKYKTWHKYSDLQIKTLKDTILHIANRDNIDVRAGLPTLIKSQGVKAFDFCDIKYVEKNKGLWNHTNVRSDKFDMFPQQELIDMLLSL